MYLKIRLRTQLCIPWKQNIHQLAWHTSQLTEDSRVADQTHLRGQFKRTSSFKKVMDILFPGCDSMMETIQFLDSHSRIIHAKNRLYQKMFSCLIIHNFISALCSEPCCFAHFRWPNTLGFGYFLQWWPLKWWSKI